LSDGQLKRNSPYCFSQAQANRKTAQPFINHNPCAQIILNANRNGMRDVRENPEIKLIKEKRIMSKKNKKNAPSGKNRNAGITAEKRQAKKDVVLGSEKKGRMPLMVAIVCSALIIAGGVYFATTDRGDSSPVAAGVAPENTASLVSLPASLFDDGKARHFEHVSGDFKIKYFVLKSSDGVIRAAFDACDVCWPAGRGYFQEGDYMVCRNCGRKFASVLVNEVKGGCNPAPLNRRVDNGEVIIEVKDILEGRQYFNFSGKV
jgi:uncharacterized membrane protein